jgi:hypothetical protein
MNRQPVAAVAAVVLGGLAVAWCPAAQKGEK